MKLGFFTKGGGDTASGSGVRPPTGALGRGTRGLGAGVTSDAATVLAVAGTWEATRCGGTGCATFSCANCRSISELTFNFIIFVGRSPIDEWSLLNGEGRLGGFIWRTVSVRVAAGSCGALGGSR